MLATFRHLEIVRKIDEDWALLASFSEYQGAFPTKSKEESAAVGMASAISVILRIQAKQNVCQCESRDFNS